MCTAQPSCKCRACAMHAPPTHITWGGIKRRESIENLVSTSAGRRKKESREILMEVRKRSRQHPQLVASGKRWMLWDEIEESEKGRQPPRESNPGHLWLEPPVLCHWATTAGQPPTLTILYMHCTGGTECLSRTRGSHSVGLWGRPEILSNRKELMLSGFLTLNAKTPNGVLRGGGCPAVVAQWQSTGGSSQRCPGFDSRRLPAFFTFLYFRLITSKFIYFQLEARCS